MPLEYHEPYEELSPQAREIHRAVQSLVEELEAFDWYMARVDVTKDAGLKSVLAHNMNEEVEHAAMVLEWLRRLIPQFDLQLRNYLFTAAPIGEVEEQAGKAGHGGLNVGSLH
ncbi:MAG: ferritin-like domain-containing protein [Candidatus Hydrogenedentes bacterium]|nr:ferritin-like domain-containing protein [Candidatus Hydrogenedentota bacterium]